MHGYSRLALLGMLGLALALVCGCGGGGQKGATVRGKLVKGGQPAPVEITGKQLPPGDSGRMKVMFYPVKADNEPIVGEKGDIIVVGGEQAGVEADGTFKVTGAKGTGISPGKYRIVITHIDPFTSKDLLKGRFSEANSKITRDVTGDQELIIDLDKPTG